MAAVKLEQIDGLRDRLHPARAVRRAVAAKHRSDGRALDGARPVVLEASGPRSGADQLTIGGAVAAIGASRCRCAVELGVAEPDAPLLSFEVRRGAAAADDRWCRAVERLLDGSFGSDAALDRRKLDVAGGAFWALRVVALVESDDGAAADCCGFAASAALNAARLPGAAVDDAGAVELRPGADAPVPGRPLPLALLAAPLTCAVFEGAVLADPTAAEAAVATPVTVVAAVDATAPPGAPTTKLLKVLVPGGDHAVPATALAACVAMAGERAKGVAFPR